MEYRGIEIETGLIGTLSVVEDGSGICFAHIGALSGIELKSRIREEESPLLAEASRQLEEYFAGDRRAFSLPLSYTGTSFQMDVWKALLEIPYGKCRSYGEIAAAVGRPKAARAVGMANHANEIAIIIPCHRVIGADGSLTGYGGGIENKKKLLELERSVSEK